MMVCALSMLSLRLSFSLSQLSPLAFSLVNSILGENQIKAAQVAFRAGGANGGVCV